MDKIAEFTGLGTYLDMPLRTYSSGMLMRLAFAIATEVEPDIILMDEWLSVGDKAPGFTLPNQEGENVSLSDFSGKKVVLWFFTKASTSG